MAPRKAYQERSCFLMRLPCFRLLMWVSGFSICKSSCETQTCITLDDDVSLLQTSAVWTSAAERAIEQAVKEEREFRRAFKDSPPPPPGREQEKASAKNSLLHSDLEGQVKQDPYGIDEGDVKQNTWKHSRTRQKAEKESKPHVFRYNSTGNRSRTRFVHVALFMDNIDDISASGGTWRGDLIVDVRYNSSDFSEAPPTIQIDNGKITGTLEESTHVMGDVTMKTFKWKIDISWESTFDLFPFDEHDLETSVSVKGFTDEELRLVKDPKLTSGIRPEDEKTGRHWKAAQFRTLGWKFDVGKQVIEGMPYNKSHASISIRVRRWLPYYLLSCIALPIMPLLFAMGTFHLPINPITPRIMISFVAFLTTFVHLKQMMSLVPVGVWCWLFTELTLFCTILCIAIITNILNAVVEKHNAKLAMTHDRFLKFALLFEFVFSEGMLLAFKSYHVWIGLFFCVPFFVAYHSLTGACTYLKAVGTDFGLLEPLPGLLLFKGYTKVRKKSVDAEAASRAKDDALGAEGAAVMD